MHTKKHELDRETILLLGLLSLTFSVVISLFVPSVLGYEISQLNRADLVTAISCITGILWCISLIRNC